ncbi:unnamed protein product [Heligmosomoides polygyrus]|uniref:adenosine deaminase n=1 Tax=Heligmosomoides polygyrus TaxID=6339 RepID=A0A183FEQ9_HELPZ|nr:unnamed protein product [Heligmosomoides polygyrus]
MGDSDMYKQYFVDDHRILLEACPYSSVMIGAVPLEWKHHPIATWAKDKVNFSISRDDPTCFDNTMLSDLHLVQHLISSGNASSIRLVRASHLRMRNGQLLRRSLPLNRNRIDVLRLATLLVFQNVFR